MMKPLKKGNLYSSSRKVKISTTGIYRIFRGLKFEPVDKSRSGDAEIGQISVDFEKCCFEIYAYLQRSQDVPSDN